MGFFDSLFNFLSKAENYAEQKSNSYSSGYGNGQRKVSNMSDTELRTSLKNSQNKDLSDFKRAGEVRAMVDEYKKRNK